MHMATDSTAAPPPVAAPATSLDTAKYLEEAKKTTEEAIKIQQNLMAISMQANTAMAYLQMALSVSGKVAGR
jgi:hypothetical protein